MSKQNTKVNRIRAKRPYRSKIELRKRAIEHEKFHHPKRFQFSSTEYEIVGKKEDRWGIKGRLLAAGDFETDPFAPQRIVEPFCIGVWDNYEYISYWSDTPDDVCEWLISWLSKRPPMFIYFHNGGNFDFWFLRKHWRGDPIIINGRIAEIQIGDHILRDSVKILPVALAELGGKLEINYDKLERNVREQHKAEILSYLKQDCKTLYDNVRIFFDEFGFHLTVGTAAIKELERYHEFERLSPAIDAEIRPFFYGGRNQCFETGILKGNWKIYDVNSMYPYVMRSYQHPIGTPSFFDDTIRPGKTAFIECEAENYGCLPFRTERGDLDFTRERGHFFLSVHEYLAGRETGTLVNPRTIRTINFTDWGNFAKFVDLTYAKRMAYKKAGNIGKSACHKFILNSAYGKFASNPENFSDYKITNEILKRCDKQCPYGTNCGECWEPHTEIGDGYFLWGKPIVVQHWHYFNVATGASITGAARSYLLRALANAKRPAYCDTDSIICESLDAELDATELGAWKLEGEGDILAIAGKKTYVLVKRITAKLYTEIQHEMQERGKFSKRQAETIDGATYEIVKKATKGGELTGQEIFDLCRGAEVEKESPRPKFKLSGKVLFTKRRFKATARLKKQGARFGK